MKMTLWRLPVALLATGMLAATSAVSTVDVAAAAPAQVSATPAQRVDNIGASGAWWVNDLGRFAPDVQRRVADLLFGQSGIQLSAYRYNIGGGGVGVNPGDRAPQTFLVRPGTYDWSRDPGGRTFLRAAAERGVPDLIGFVNSAPAVWTTNGKTCGGQLTPQRTGDFADYVVDIVEHFRDEGVTIDYVSPMNEPTHTFGDCGQEGMEVPVAARDDIVRTVGSTLAGRVPTTRITADESTSASVFVNEVPQWMNTSGTAPFVSRLAHHTYDFPSNAALTAAGDVGSRFGKPTWASEICCFAGINAGWGQQYDPTIVSGLAMSDIIHRDFTHANSSAFHWWTAVSKMIGCSPAGNSSCATSVNSSGWNDGLIYYDPNFASNGNQALYLTKRFYALGQYSKFVRPGAVRHAVSGTPSGVGVTAFQRSGTWTLVVHNLNTVASTVDVTVNGASRLRATGSYRTSASQSLSQVANPPVSGRTVSLSLPARSITTYVFQQ